MNNDDRPMLPLEKIFIGQKLYQPDFSADDGIEEIVVHDVLMYTIVENEDEVTSGDIFCMGEILEITDNLEKCDYHSIVLEEGWETNPYELFLTRHECQEYVLIELNRITLEQEEMIKNGQNAVTRYKKISKNILKELKYDN